MTDVSIEQQQSNLLSGVGCSCAPNNLEAVHEYTSRPEGESPFPLAEGREYRRILARCKVCKHTVSAHLMLSDPAKLYEADYVSATYGDEEGLRRNFARITNLPEGKSDNRIRAERVDFFCRSQGLSSSLLDVGSGLAVFVYEMGRRGWDCVALDTDRRLTEHAEEVASVRTITGDFFTAHELEMYNVITFNKVLEHVSRPVDFMIKARQHLLPGGVIYVEVPDGVGAASVGYGREEFFIEHLHVFSSESLAVLLKTAGFHIKKLEAMVEPSGKFTLYAFAKT